MSSTIAELLVKIGGDSSGLSKELATSQVNIRSAFSASPINAFTGAMAEASGSISSVVGRISGLAALAAGGFGLGALVENAVHAGEAVYQLGNQMGISTMQALELSRILSMTGADSTTFAAAMTRLDKNFSASGETGDRVRGILAAFGVELADSNGKLLPLNQQLANLSKGYKLAAENGLQQEFIMNTLGTRGLALAQTLRDYDEAARNAAKVKGIGLNPEQMHELKEELEVVKIQAGQVGLAFTSAFAPVAHEIFPPIMAGLSGVAAFLAENRSGVIELTKVTFELVVAYKSVQLLSSAAVSIGSFWQDAATQARVAAVAQAEAAAGLTAAQEAAIGRAVAASDKMHAKMQADAIKTANTAGLSADAAAIVIAEKCVQISTASAAAAAAIREKMTTAYLAAAEGATASGTKVVAANEAAAASARVAAVAQGQLGTATSATGLKTVSAMSTAKAAAGNFLSGLWSLAGGWVGVAVATAIAIDKLLEYFDTKNKVDSYDKKAEVYDDPTRPGRHLKKQWTEGTGVTDIGTTTGGYMLVPLDSAEEEEHTAFSNWRNGQANQKPWLQGSSTETAAALLAAVKAAMEGKNTGADAAERAVENMRKKAQDVNNGILSDYYAMNGAKVDAVNIWYAEEKAKLEASKAENTAYDAALAQLDAVRDDKLRKAKADMFAESTGVFLDAAKNARDLQNTVSSAGLAGPTKDLLEMQNRYNDALAEAEEKYVRLSVQFMGMDKKAQGLYLAANPDVQVKDDGALDFSKRIAAENLATQKNYDRQLRDYHAEEKSWEFALDQAYADRSMAQMQTLLNSQAAAQAQYRAGQTAAVREYYDLWVKTHRSSMDEMAEAAQSFDQGLAGIFMDIGRGIRSTGDLFRSFGDMVVNTILRIQAERVAAQMTTSLFGSLLGAVGSTPASSTSTYRSGINVLNGGWGSGPTWQNPTNYTFKVPGLASGGIATGPTLALIGERPGVKEAVVPLTPAGLRAAGIAGNQVQVIVNNNAGVNVAANSTTDMHGLQKIVLDLTLDGAARNVNGFSRNLKTALGG